MAKRVQGIEFTKASSKGQIVIPTKIRKKLDIREGSVLAVATEKDMIVLKKVESSLSAEDLSAPVPSADLSAPADAQLRSAAAAREVRIGDMLRVTNDSGDFQVEVLLLSEVRGPAPVAQTLYRETEASRELRLKAAEERKAMRYFEGPREGRPSKRNRREIIRFRGRG